MRFEGPANKRRVHEVIVPLRAWSGPSASTAASATWWTTRASSTPKRRETSFVPGVRDAMVKVPDLWSLAGELAT